MTAETNTNHELINQAQKNQAALTTKWWKKFLRPELITFVLLIVSLVVSLQISPYFADTAFILDSTSMFVEFGIIALSMTFVIIAGQIDLSVASVMALSSCITAVLFHSGVGMTVSILFGLLTGLACGFFNGLLVTRLQLPALIVTIGTMALYRGIAQVFLGDHSLGKFPEWFVGIDMKHMGNSVIPVPLLIFAVLAVILGAVLNLTIFGRRVYSLGTNETAALYSAVRVNFMKIVIFCLSGLFASIGGILMLSRLGVSRFDMATGGELDVITIVLLGGTEITGGKGNIVGSFLAFFIIVILKTGMSVANIKAENQLTVMGSLLILAIVIPNIITMIKEKRAV